ncbi:hypothetical protein GE061_005390 [Apolygus lucorum]|uniref:Thioredoxin domain-containing protein n=1 Tax=Apolygus lucorum TaxID=248454 RepID=A0A8S9WW79_APOLU|nr:hypothetical protein GE061_005390 [Apolygus lucorum]
MLLEVLQFAVGAARSAIFTHASAEAPDRALNWGTKILWHTTLKEAEEVSAKTNKPVMVIIYHEYCPSCKMIIPRLTQDDQIVELSKQFTVVALHDTKAEDTMKVDGGYIPRIYFMAPNGQVLNKFYNIYGNPKFKFIDVVLVQVLRQYYNEDGNPRYKNYFPPNGKSLGKTMRKVLKDFTHDLCHGNRPCKLHAKRDRTNYWPKSDS